MIVGTIGSFAMIVVANENSQRDQARIEALTSEYQLQYSEHQAKLDAQTEELSAKYYETLKAYTSRVAPFNKGSVEELVTEDLVVGTGDDITVESSFTAYYIGWNPDGKIFDQSIDGDRLKEPYMVTAGTVIDGWSLGAEGMRVGGIRELTIPSDLAYGSTKKSDDIPADTPLKFVIMIIPTPETIEPPAMSEELLNYYQTGRI